MAGWLTHLLEGNNLSEFEKMSHDGDPKHLGTIGHNLTLIAMTERAAARAEAIRLSGEAEVAAQARQRELNDASLLEAQLERQHADRTEAVRLSALPKETRAKELPDSDEGVDQFLKLLF